MTREEAIKWLKTFKGNTGMTELSQAFDVAIDALSAEPCEDAISRAEALKAINEMDIPEDMSVFEIKSHIGVEISILPPVQPQPKIGHWIILPPIFEEICKCSNCHSKFKQALQISNSPCPNCGCRMV